MQLKLKKSTYPLKVVLHTCHLFNSKLFLEVQDNKSNVLVDAKLKRGKSEKRLKSLLAEFHNELQFQVLRLKVAKENKKMREMVIEQALSASLPSTESVEQTRSLEEAEIDKELEEILQEVEAESYKDDPLGIAVPWEEKYGEKQEKDDRPQKD